MGDICCTSAYSLGGLVVILLAIVITQFIWICQLKSGKGKVVTFTPNPPTLIPAPPPTSSTSSSESNSLLEEEEDE